ncbi:putative two-component sensor response regulator [Paenibacillus montaniterrae]|uniref:Two-component sensor response regulator n=1 Tax=Paenibacillus montaniterrae TaxID=429341 RepID=A0A920CVI7_9BACL|nr:response regulator [Paenibacillus montaniterrae]GIP18187.1 putative two-component sensor response regulator [Paenibacillus montaniterrae]
MYQLLIVDDQPDLVEDLATNIDWSSIGISSVYQAHSANEALDTMKMTQIDIVITDIRMPGISGLDLIEAIKASWSHVKCILLSGYNDFEYAQRALQYQASDYLLKPVEDNELLEAVQKAIGELEQHWLEISSWQKAISSIKANLPILRSHLLTTLLHKQLPQEQLQKRLSMVELLIPLDSPCYMMLLRMEDYFYEQSEQDSSLLEYAICNIAEEIFDDGYRLWHVKDSYGYYAFLILPALQGEKGSFAADDSAVSALNAEVIEQKAAHLQHYVKLYLKGTISLVLSQQLSFPQQLTSVYEQLLRSFRQRIGSERDFLLTMHEERAAESDDADCLSELYAPPLLNHLLEIGQWDAVEEKLHAIFNELEQKRGDSHEHILEAYYAIVSSLSYAIHKNKLRMADCLGDEFNHMLEGPRFHTIAQLRVWLDEVIQAYKRVLSERSQDSRTGVIQKVQEYAAQHLTEASLQSLADHVFLNASYLSKIYKLETGEGISEYLSRLRMETAAHLLRTTNEKIYEISVKVGYNKTSYFIKVFKDRYGVTPQEYRDQ